MRWGIVTDGRQVKLYDGRMPNVTAENRLLFHLDLAGYSDREDFEVAIYPHLQLLSKASLSAETPLEERAAREGVREILQAPGSSTVAALRRELEKKKLVHLTDAQLTDLLSDLLG